MRCCLICIAMDVELRKGAGEQYFVAKNRNRAYAAADLCLSSSLCGEASGLFMLGRSLLHSPQGVIQEAGHDDATQARPG